MFKVCVKDYYNRCGLRDKGKEFYNLLLDIIPEGEKCILFDFKNVTYVSSSFLDESLFKLLNNYDIAIKKRRDIQLEKKVKRIIDWHKLDNHVKDSSNNILIFSI